MTGDRRKNVYSRFEGDIRKRPVAIIAQQGMPHGCFPRTPYHVKVHPAIVVVIRLENAEPAGEVGEPCLGRPVLEGSVPIVMEVVEGLAMISS